MHPFARPLVVPPPSAGMVGAKDAPLINPATTSVAVAVVAIVAGTVLLYKFLPTPWSK